MMDIVSPEHRSALMSRIRGKNTGIEVTVRKGLHHLGFRYRLGGGGLPGRPDIVLPKYRTVVFVHGCFWHGHDCPLYRLPKTRTAFWQAKVEANRERDPRVQEALARSQWRAIVVWECSLRGRSEADKELTVRKLAKDIRSES